MKKLKKVTKQDIPQEVEASVPEVVLPTEKEQLLERQSELLSVLDYLTTNKFQDKGQIEVVLSQVNQRLTEI